METAIYLMIGFIGGILFALVVDLIRSKINKHIVIKREDEN